ncbi:MAG: ATP-binding domain-containing protein, partial [Lactococcus sp.]
LLPADFTARKPDRSYFESRSQDVPYLISQIAGAWKKKGNNPFELQILAPMYKGQAGINTLNLLLQNLFNPLEDRLEFKFNDIQFREGDKVLHLVNDASANVFNGDLGLVSELIAAKHSDSKQDEIVMDFDGQEVSYPRAEWYKITLAYAMSIHKSQGSEFSTVIVPMVSSYSRMLERNLLYTAITRAKQSLILIGQQRAFEQAVAKEGSNRKTYLIERFSNQTAEIAEPVKIEAEEKSKEAINNQTNKAAKIENEPEEILLFEQEEEKFRPSELTEAIINSGQFDPLIGLTEADFMIFKQ